MNAAQLGSTLSDSLKGTRLIVVANREPYIHLRRKRGARGIVELAARPEGDRRHRVDAAGERPRHRARPGDARDAAAPGSRTAAATPIAKPPTRAAACRCRPIARRTPCGACGSRRKKSRAITTAAPTARSGRSVTSPTRVPNSTMPTGSSTCRVNRRFADAVIEEVGRRSRRGVRAGLSLRAAAAIREGGAARRDRLPVLAHPVAESRSVSRLPVGRGHPARPARQRSARLPRPVSLQQLPRHRRSRARVARRLRALRGLARRPADLRAAVSDQHRSVALEGAGESRRARRRRSGTCARRSASTASASSSASIASTTPRAFPIA